MSKGLNVAVLNGDHWGERRSFAQSTSDPASEADPCVAEVIAVYGRTIFDVQHVGHPSPGRARSPTGAKNSVYAIGEGSRVQWATPPGDLPDPAWFPLVTRDSRGRVTLRFTPSMTGTITCDRTNFTLQQWAGHEAVVREPGDVVAIELAPRARAMIVHGAITFFVRVVDPAMLMATRRSPDRPFWIYNAASAVVLGTWLVMAHFQPLDPRGLDLEDELRGSRFVGYMHRPDHPPAEDVPTGSDAVPASDAGGSSPRHAGAEGKIGNPREIATGRRSATRGPRDAVPAVAREFDPEHDARREGILGVLQSSQGHALASVFGGAFAVGKDDTDAWGEMTGQAIGDAAGLSGLGSIGSGRGGGGNAEGLVGFSGVGLIRGGGGGDGGGLYGRGSGGSAFGPRASRAPRVIASATGSQVRGALDRDVIRRVVRAHINEVRHCYNQGLVRDPGLRGRVAVQFSVGGAGGVVAASVQESSLRDASVGHCIAQAVRRWRFPRPQDGGHVIVTYPFVLHPG